MLMIFLLPRPRPPRVSREICGKMQSAPIFRAMCHGRRRGSPAVPSVKEGRCALHRRPRPPTRPPSIHPSFLPLCEILLLLSVCLVTMTNSIVFSHLTLAAKRFASDMWRARMRGEGYFRPRPCNAMETGVPAAACAWPAIGVTCKTVNNATARHNAKKVKGAPLLSAPPSSFLPCVCPPFASFITSPTFSREGRSKRQSSARCCVFVRLNELPHVLLPALFFPSRSSHGSTAHLWAAARIINSLAFAF